MQEAHVRAVDGSDEQALAARLGHNGGPALEESDDEHPWRGSDLYTYFCWKQAHDRAWKNPPREIMLLRLRRAEELGMSYRRYTLEILERGRYLQRPEGAAKP